MSSHEAAKPKSGVGTGLCAIAQIKAVNKATVSFVSTTWQLEKK
jgi:hypothetical protein